MLDFLVDHAVKNVWCSPMQDRQAMLGLTRLTPHGGVSGRVKVVWEQLHLPDCEGDWHVYQIGANSPSRFGLNIVRGKWVSALDLCNQDTLLVDVYTIDGLIMPHNECYLRLNEDNNIIVAVRLVPIVANLNDEKLYLRFFKPAYFNTEEALVTDAKITMAGGLMKSIQTIVDLQNEWIDLSEGEGHGYFIHNGRYAQSVSPTAVKPGDYLVLIHDTSIFNVVDFTLPELQTYSSTLDATQKFLLHPPKNDYAGIVFRDDVDVYILDKTQQSGKGIYYHKNREMSLRMITHRDYGIPVSFVRSFLNGILSGVADKNVIVRLHLKKAGYDRALVNEHHRIHELYKLPEDELVRAMLGIDSTITEWTVDSLEQSNYPRIMRSKYSEITPEKVIDAYGYNAVTKLIADSPIKVSLDIGEQYIDLPYSLRGKATFFEYDEDGLLLGWHVQQRGQRYYARNSETRLVEGLVGVGGSWSPTISNDDFALDTYYGHRCYHSPTINYEPTGAWVGVTASDKTYQIENGMIVWKHLKSKFVGAVVKDDKFLCYELSINTQHSFYQFTINSNPNQPDPLTILPGKIDIFMNNHGLIENLDYYLVGNVCTVVNREYLKPDKQDFLIRGTGFVGLDMARLPLGEHDFVHREQLSLNGRFDIRDDKVIRVVVDGRTFNREDLQFAENNRSVRWEQIPEGRPYRIEMVPVPLRGMPVSDVDAWRDASIDLDNRLSDYLTLKIPEPTFTTPIFIPRFYFVYSPLMARLLADIKNGALVIPFLNGGDRQIREIVTPYLDILEVDPVHRGYNVDYVRVLPHPLDEPVGVVEREWVFLQAVNRIYLKTALDFTNLVTITGL